MSEERKYPPRKKDDELGEITKAAIRDRVVEGKLDVYQIAQEFSCSASQVAGIKAVMTKGGK